MIEFALLAPLMLAILYAVIVAGLLFLAKDKAQNGVDVLAQLVAYSENESWRSKVPDEDRRVNCNGDKPEVSYPDGDQEPGSRVLVRWTCHFDTRGWLLHGLPIRVESEAVIPFRPALTPAPEATP